MIYASHQLTKFFQRNSPLSEKVKITHLWGKILVENFEAINSDEILSNFCFLYFFYYLNPN